MEYPYTVYEWGDFKLERTSESVYLVTIASEQQILSKGRVAALGLDALKDVIEEI